MTPRALVVRAVVLALFVLGLSSLAVDWSDLDGWGWVRRTDDARVEGDPVRLAARVAGYVAEVAVTDYQAVRVGELLYKIADEDYRAREQRAAADVASAEAAVAVAAAQLELQSAQLGVAEAAIRASDAELQRARRERVRQDDLLHTEGGSPREWENARAGEERTAAALAGNERALAADRAQIEAQRATVEQQQAALAARRAAHDLAVIELGYTNVTAPADGIVTARLARPGQYVAAGTQLITLVPAAGSWIVANYREVQLTSMRVGAPATIHVDALPNTELRGHVDSIGPTSEARASLLPPDRSVGSFTKIVQRVPVKIVFEPGQPAVARLQPGLSAEVAVDTGYRVGGDRASDSPRTAGTQ